MGVVPKKTKTEQRIFRHINLTKIVGFIVTLLVASQLSGMLVSSKLGIPFIIFCGAVFIIMSGSCRSAGKPVRNLCSGNFRRFRRRFGNRPRFGRDIETAGRRRTK